MTVYIDKDYKCHKKAADGLTAVDSAFFDGKCDAFVEGYRFVPAGEHWTREDGEVFCGEMIAPSVDYAPLEEAQTAYEREKLSEYELLINELYEEVV